MNRKIFFIISSLLVVSALVLLLYRELSPEDQQAAQQCSGAVAYEWNTPVTKNLNGFPRYVNEKNLHNGNWITPVNYAEGTLYYRVQIKNQPKPQDMKLQLCFWQSRPAPTPGSGPHANENCGSMKEVKGTPGNVVTWSYPVQSMWKKDGIVIDWSRPRLWVGVAIKNSKGDPVSSYSGWNWNGENPDNWYPLDMRFTAVVVPKGGTFCGWDHYITGGTGVPDTETPEETVTPSPTPDLGSTSTPTPTNTPVPSSSTTPTPTATPGPSTTLPVGTAQPSSTLPQGNICGKADADGDGVFKIHDFGEFAKAYGNGKNTCADRNVDYGPCGGRDVNRDGFLNIGDFGTAGTGFAQRYYPKTSCAL